MLELLVIADDLTGAADTSVRFCSLLEKVWIFPGHVQPRSRRPLAPTLWGVHTDSRAASPQEAYVRTRVLAETLQKMAPKLVYKKVDSCMRGNVGVEVQALLEVLGKPCAFIAPAHPEMGRTTLGGIHLVNGVPVSQTEMGRDPLSPVKSSKLEELVSGPSRLPVAHLSLELVQDSQQKLRRRLEGFLSKGVRHLSFDALDMNHMRKIASMALSMGALPVGSAALATALAQVHFKTRAVSNSKLFSRGLSRHLVVVGSKSQKARAQASFLLRSPFVKRVAVLPFPFWMGQRPWEPLPPKGPACVLLSPELPKGKRPQPGQITEALAIAATEIARSWSPQTLFLTGGETAKATLSRMGVARIRLLGEPQPGVVLGRAWGGLKPGVLVLTKAGAFGDDQVIARVLEILSKGSSPAGKGED